MKVCVLSCNHSLLRRKEDQSYIQALFVCVFQLRPESLQALSCFNSDQAKVDEHIEAELELVFAQLHEQSTAQNIVTANPFKKAEKVSRLRQLILALSLVYDKMHNSS